MQKSTNCDRISGQKPALQEKDFQIPENKPPEPAVIGLANYFCPRMFRKLRHKWGVGPGRLALILCTFAIGGSLCGRLGGFFLDKMGVESLWLYIPLYIVLVTLLWPLCVLLISIPFGQWRFFTAYLRQMGHRISRRKSQSAKARHLHHQRRQQ